MSTLKEFSNSLIFPLGDKLPEQFSKFFYWSSSFEYANYYRCFYW